MSQTATSQVSGQTLEEHTLWSPVSPPRKHKICDEPLSPVILAGFPTPHARTSFTIRSALRKILKNVLKLLSWSVEHFGSSRAHHVLQLQVFVEVHHETFCDPEQDVLPLRKASRPRKARAGGFT